MHVKQAIHPSNFDLDLRDCPGQGAPHETLLHELQVRQLELEVQNEALQQNYEALDSAKTDIEAGLGRYAALYELAPLAYFTLSPEGLVLKTNRMGQARLGPGLPQAGPQRFAALLEKGVPARLQWVS